MQCQHKAIPFEAIEWTGKNAKAVAKLVMGDDEGETPVHVNGQALSIDGVYGRSAPGDWITANDRYITAADFEAHYEAVD